MKLTRLTYLGISIGLLSSQSLFAQNSSKIIDSRKSASLSEDQTDQQAKITESYELRTTSNNQGDDFGCSLMMNPSTLEEGRKIIGKALGVEGRGIVAAEKTMAEGEGGERSDVVSSVASSFSSNQILILRGGGDQQSCPTRELKSTGDTSEKEVVEADERDSFITQLQNNTIAAIEDVKNLSFLSLNRDSKKNARNELLEAVRWLVEPSKRDPEINKAITKMLTKEKNRIFKDPDAAWVSFEESRIAVRNTNDAVKTAKKAEQDEVKIKNNVTKNINSINNSEIRPKIIKTISNLVPKNDIIDIPITEKNIDQGISSLTTTVNFVENLRMADKKRNVESAVNHSDNAKDNLSDSKKNAYNKESQAIKNYSSFVQTVAFRVKERFPGAIPFKPIMSADAEEKIRIANATEKEKKDVFDGINKAIKNIEDERRKRACAAAEARVEKNKKNIVKTVGTSLRPEEVDEMAELHDEEKKLNDAQNKINQADWEYDIAKKNAERIREREEVIIAAENTALINIWPELIKDNKFIITSEKNVKKDIEYYQNKTKEAAEQAISKAEKAKKFLQQYEQGIEGDAYNNEIDKISSWFNEIKETFYKSLNEAKKATEAAAIVMKATTIEEAENKAKEAEEARDNADQASQKAWIYYTSNQNKNFINPLITNINPELFKENANKERQEGNTILAKYWTSTADAAEKVILYCKNANNNIENGNIILAKYWTAATENVEDAITYLKNAIKANKIGNPNAALNWNEAAQKALETSLSWEEMASIFQNHVRDQGNLDDLRYKELASFNKFKAKSLKDIAAYNKKIAEIRSSNRNEDIINQLSISWQFAIIETENAIKRNEQYERNNLDIDYTDLYFARFGVNNENKDENGNLLKYWDNVLQTTRDIIEYRSIPNTWLASIESAYRQAAACWINAAKEKQQGNKDLVFYWVDAANSNNNLISYKLNAAKSNKLSLYWIAAAKSAETIVSLKINAAYAAKKGNNEEVKKFIDQANVEENFIANSNNAIKLQAQGKETLAECYLIIDKAKWNIDRYRNKELENYDGEKIDKYRFTMLKNSWMEARTAAENIESYANKAISNSENKILFKYYFNAVKATEAATKNKENVVCYLKSGNSDEVSFYKLIAESYENEAALWIKAVEAVENHTSDQVYIDEINHIIRNRDKV